MPGKEEKVRTLNELLASATRSAGRRKLSTLNLYWSLLGVFEILPFFQDIVMDHDVRDYLAIPGSKDVAYDCAGAFLRHYSSIQVVRFTREFRPCLTDQFRERTSINMLKKVNHCSSVCLTNMLS